MHWKPIAFRVPAIAAVCFLACLCVPGRLQAADQSKFRPPRTARAFAAYWMVEPAGEPPTSAYQKPLDALAPLIYSLISGLVNNLG